MIRDKESFVKNILEKYPETRGDGNGIFLNKIVGILFGEAKIDFTVFCVETYVRARRKVLEKNPSLDNRTNSTYEAEKTAKEEMRNG